MLELRGDERLKAIVSQLWTYYGSPPSKLSALYYSSPLHDYLTNGAYYPKGGGKALSDVLVDSIKENGGRIIFNTKVKIIFIKENTAYGARVEDGQEFFAEYVISNIDVHATFKNLIGQEYFNKLFIDEINKMEELLIMLNLTPRHI